ncbi:ATP-binding protein [Amycolatopsis orientalis]|uniref:ATP-binding protein n=1 Tax=Amycolatopsis orientalis TaxID=31958 RepID=UPI00039CF942|nr:ATP-binding protein [Amycolatopsis orientalis]
MYRNTPDPSVERSEAEPAAPPVVSAPIDASVKSRFEELAPAQPREAAILRQKLAHWLKELPLDARSEFDITLAAYEALANVAAHAYPGGTGWTRLYADWAGDTVTVTVSDTGCGIAPERKAAPSSGGRGLPLIDEVTDRMSIDTGEHGTTVTMVWRPAALRQDTAA